jgi:general secretion pathway protein M
MNALTTFWNQRSEQEKTLLVTAGGLLALALVILILIEPAWTGRSRLRSELPSLRAELAHMQEQATQSRQLAAAAQGSALTGEALRTALALAARQHSLGAAQISPNGTGARVVCSGVSFADWVEWLDEARHQYRVRVSEAHVTALADGRVDARVTLDPS